MCGIVGLFDLSGRGRLPERGILEGMNRVQRHRGPDGEGVHLEPGVGLGHQRLAIIDLEGGHQPLFNETGDVAVILNGEIYNFAALTRELQERGHQFATRSDTETLVHAWEEWGEGCLDRLEGMFALAIWDRRQATLFLARDRLGIKPLHYALLGDGWLLFASELKGIMAHPGFRRELNPQGVESYFAYGYIPDPLTIFSGASKLPPGHALTLSGSANASSDPSSWDIVPRSYWHLDFSDGGSADFSPGAASTSNSDASFEAASEALLVRLEAAVQSHLVSDVPVSAFLSGGVDSSAVVALMARLSGERISACTVSFDDPRFDEAPHAARFARGLGIDHRVERAGSDHFQWLDHLAGDYDEPFADPSALPTRVVCQMARKGGKVVLSGDGGDEVWAGYDRYPFFMAEERVRGMVPGMIRAPLFGLLGRLYPKADWAPRMFRAKSTFQSLAMDSVAGHFHGVSVVSDVWRQRLFTSELKKSLQGWQAVEVLRKHAADGPDDHPLHRAQYLDLKTFLPARVLTKVDRASMAWGLEVRVPLLDHRLVEWSAGLPSDFKLRGREGKRLFKKGLVGLLPQEVMARPKMGFSPPLADWLRGPLQGRVGESLLGERFGDCGYFDRKVIQGMIQQHQKGLADHAAPLWSLLMFEAFLRRF
ncbi:MAG: amidotransferase 1, exosortase A system-associated [Magnetococcales bacterium]|nr:amidotransferase 1, exosortase A system-associated [Magnetococcales bacterium]